MGFWIMVMLAIGGLALLAIGIQKASHRASRWTFILLGGTLLTMAIFIGTPAGADVIASLT